MALPVFDTDTELDVVAELVAELEGTAVPVGVDVAVNDAPIVVLLVNVADAVSVRDAVAVELTGAVSVPVAVAECGIVIVPLTVVHTDTVLVSLDEPLVDSDGVAVAVAESSAE